MTARRIVLSSYFGNDAIPLGAAVAEALEADGHAVARVHCQPEPWTHRWFARHVAAALRRVVGRDVEAAIPGSSARARDHALMLACRGFRPDTIIAILGNAYAPGLVRRLAGVTGARTVGWWVKDTRCRQREAEVRGEFQDFFTIGPWPEQRFTLLPAVAADHRRWHRPATAVVQDIPILFVGGWNPRRDPFFRALNGLPVACHGPHWTRRGHAAFHRSDGLWGEALLAAMHRARIVLNIPSFPTADGGGANLRLADVPLTGSLLLSEDGPALRGIYGADIPAFQTPTELRAAVERLLADDGARLAAAQRMHAIAQALPTYADVARRLLAGP
jgi:hypothetical protein